MPHVNVHRFESFALESYQVFLHAIHFKQLSLHVNARRITFHCHASIHELVYSDIFVRAPRDGGEEKLHIIHLQANGDR